MTHIRREFVQFFRTLAENKLGSVSMYKGKDKEKAIKNAHLVSSLKTVADYLEGDNALIPLENGRERDTEEILAKHDAWSLQLERELMIYWLQKLQGDVERAKRRLAEDIAEAIKEEPEYLSEHRVLTDSEIEEIVWGQL